MVIDRPPFSMPSKPLTLVIVDFTFDDLCFFLWCYLLIVSPFVTGAVGLTCLGLVVFNWKLQQGKANEHTSENLPCRTFNESLCDHEARNYHAQGYCNCHLTQENEIKVMSIVGARKEMPLSQESSHQAVQASGSTALDRSFRNLKGKGHGADSTFFCFGGRLLQSGCSEPSGNMAAFNEAGLLTRYCPQRVEGWRNREPGEGQPQTLPQHVTRTTGELPCLKSPIWFKFLLISSKE